MAKARTLNQLQDRLDSEMAWRIQEISTLKLAAKNGGVTRKVFIRAGVALVYAHWEGFIKSSSEAYLGYVESQGHTYRALKPPFAVFGLKGKLSTLAESKKARVNTEAFEFILDGLDNPAKMAISSAVNTESNLTSKVFANIAASLDIDTAGYETKFNLIDESLVHRRNMVAHGEYLDLEENEFRNLADEVLVLMRDYKTDLQNSASLKSYCR